MMDNDPRAGLSYERALLSGDLRQFSESPSVPNQLGIGGLSAGRHPRIEGCSERTDPIEARSLKTVMAAEEPPSKAFSGAALKAVDGGPAPATTMRDPGLSSDDPFGSPIEAGRLPSDESLVSPQTLSLREQEVLEALTTDRPLSAIALDLGIGMATLKVHMNRIYRTLRVRSRAEAVATIRTPDASEATILSGLGPRERTVLEFLANGRSTDDIAHELNIAVSTLRGHLQKIYRVLRVKNRRQAVTRFRGDSAEQPETQLTDHATPLVPARLSPGERKVLGLLAEGQSRGAIALSLGITQGTLRGFVSKIYQKLGVKNEQAAIASVGPSVALPTTIRTGLNAREREVLALMADDQSTKDIAARLDISTGTAFVYISNIYRVTGLKTRAQVVARFREEQLPGSGTTHAAV